MVTVEEGMLRALVVEGSGSYLLWEVRVYEFAVGQLKRN
jgi:hypothetical protein